VLIPPGDLHISASPPACRWEVGPDWSEDPHREATRGVGPVTGSAGSESRSGRGGRHPASSPCSRSGTGPAGPRGGDRVLAGLPERARVPGRRRFCRRRVGKPESRPALLEANRSPSRSRFAGGGMGTESAKASAGADPDPDHRRFCRRWEGDPDGNTSSTPRGNSRSRPDDGAAGAEEPDGRGGRHHHLDPRASWCSYHREALTLLPLRDWPCRSQGWRPGPSRLAGGDAVPEAQPACRRGVGNPESRLVLPEADRPPGRSRFAGCDMGPGHRRPRPEVTRIRTITGSAGDGKEPGRHHMLHTAGRPAAPTR
jgi:hypothetical protein